jgi:hypothetical protein
LYLHFLDLDNGEEPSFDEDVEDSDVIPSDEDEDDFSKVIQADEDDVEELKNDVGIDLCDDDNEEDVDDDGRL